MLYISVRNEAALAAVRRLPRARREPQTPDLTDLSLYQRHLQNFVVADRPVTKKTVFSEKLAVIGRNRNVGVIGNDVEQLFNDPVQIAHRVDLAFTQRLHLFWV